MKYFLKILLVLVLAALTVLGMYYYTTGNRPAVLGGDSQYQLTTVSKPPVTEKYAALSTLGREGDYILYKSGDLIILEYQGKRYEFSGWSQDIDLEPPQMVLANIDDDAEDELIIKGVANYDEMSNSYIYTVYVVNRAPESENGFEVAVLNEAAWRSLVEKNILAALGQLNNCKKIVQLAMVANSKGNVLRLDEATGIAIDAHTGYFRALQDENGQYLTVAMWDRGRGIYSVADDGTISVDIDVDVSYDGTTEIQQAGTLSFDIALVSNTEYTIAAKSIQFTPNSAYLVAEPQMTAAAAWSYTENLTSAAPVAEMKWIKHNMKLDEQTLTQTVDVTDELGDLGGVSVITLTESGVVLKAKAGCRFSEQVANSAQYSVVINENTEGTPYDIAYTCELNESGDTLTITFDRTYAKDEIETIEINFGTK